VAGNTRRALLARLEAEAVTYPTRHVQVITPDGEPLLTVSPPVVESALIIVHGLPRRRPPRPERSWRDAEGTFVQVAERTIRDMTAQGRQPRTIAKRLNERKVRTASGGRKWTARAVEKILLELAERERGDSPPPLPTAAPEQPPDYGERLAVLRLQGARRR
jgi:hypothetical protein